MTKYNQDIASLYADQEKRENEVADEHQGVGKQISLLLNKNLNVCSIRKCRSFFLAGSQSQFCSIENCCSKEQECGCAIKECSTCGFTGCLEHFKGHHKKCKREAPHSCGWISDEEIIATDMCGKLFREEELDLCFYCDAQCCYDCCNSCRSCHEIWCKRCQTEDNMPDEPCCRYTQFHAKIWEQCYSDGSSLDGW